MNNASETNKELFLQKLNERLTFDGALLMDSIVDTATFMGIEIETAARIVSSSPPLKKRLEEESIKYRTVRAKVE